MANSRRGGIVPKNPHTTFSEVRRKMINRIETRKKQVRLMEKEIEKLTQQLNGMISVLEIMDEDEN